MKLPKYPLASGDKLLTYDFISEGPKGLIHKMVQFKRTNLKNVYNLAFGDKDLSTGEIDDTVISNNGDSEKVLATVVATVYAFTEQVSRRCDLCNWQHKNTNTTLQNGNCKIFFRTNKGL